MPRALGSVFLGLLCASSSAGLSLAQAPAKVPPPVVRLYGEADLERLRQSNLDHYRRAQRILAAANEICRPGKQQQTYLARFAGADPRCEALMWKTSNPPKKELQFRLDDVRYIALVTITDSPARVVKAH